MILDNEKVRLNPLCIIPCYLVTGGKTTQQCCYIQEVKHTYVLLHTGSKAHNSAVTYRR